MLPLSGLLFQFRKIPHFVREFDYSFLAGVRSLPASAQLYLGSYISLNEFFRR